MHAMNIEVELKDLRNRIDLAEENVDEIDWEMATFENSLLTVNTEQKRLETLVEENIN